jgi:hypothetical protein
VISEVRVFEVRVFEARVFEARVFGPRGGEVPSGADFIDLS